MTGFTTLLMVVSKGEVAATFIAPEGWVGCECVFHLAHFIRGLGIATPEEEPWAPPVLSFFFCPLPELDPPKKGVTPVGHQPSWLSALGELPVPLLYPVGSGGS